MVRSWLPFPGVASWFRVAARVLAITAAFQAVRGRRRRGGGLPRGNASDRELPPEHSLSALALRAPSSSQGDFEAGGSLNGTRLP